MKDKKPRSKIFEYKWKPYKKCTNCGCDRVVSDFPSNWYAKSGIKSYKSKCRICFNLIGRNNRIIDNKANQLLKSKRRIYTANNKEKIAEYAREYYKNLEPGKKKKHSIRTHENWKKRRDKKLNSQKIRLPLTILKCE